MKNFPIMTNKGKTMLLNAKVLKVEIKKNPSWNERTGESNPSYFLEATVIDRDTSERYQCSFRESLGTEQLLQAYREKWSETQRDDLAARIETQAKQQLENQDVTLNVIDMHAIKDFITLIVTLP